MRNWFGKAPYRRRREMMNSSYRPSCHCPWGWVGVLLAGLVHLAIAQSFDPSVYSIGTPLLTDVWIDPVNGNDTRSGSSRAQALRTLTEAWNRIPSGASLSQGFRLLLTAGTHVDTPGWYENRQGNYAAPVIFQAIDGDGTALLPAMDISGCRYLYLIGLHLRADGGDVLHFAGCHHILVRNCQIEGLGDIDHYGGPQEGMKVNQTQYLYVENCDISGGWDNAFDAVGVQYGHVIGSRIHRGGDWAMYVKGGSAYLRIDGNEIFDARTGGFTAGQGSGFEFMVSPWIHYEAENIKFVNNVIHHTGVVGMGVNGGYNILLAYNTLYKAGTNDHVIEVTHGARSCDGNVAQCDVYRAAGGWGASVNADGQYIPCRNIYIFNNLIYNPTGFSSAWQQFTVPGPVIPPASTPVPSPSAVDTNLRIQGNLIWNGPLGFPLGLGEEGQGGQAGNPTCNPTLVNAQNLINQIEPQLIDPENGDFRPIPGGTVFSFADVVIPDFPGDDRPTPPLAPEGNRTNLVLRDATGMTRPWGGPVGAFGVVSNPPSTGSRTRSDYDGDGLADLAVWHSASGNWYIRSGTGSVLAWAVPLGSSSSRVLSGDYNGDGRNDFVVYNQGRWLIRSLSGALLAADIQWGWAGAIPLSGDYNGDHTNDLVVVDPLSGRWFIRTLGGRVLCWNFNWGFSGGEFLAGDYDGDGCADLGFFYPASGRWYLYTLARNRVLLWDFGWGGSWGAARVGDYDGDGADDLVAFNRASSHWYVYSPAQSKVLLWHVQWGFPGVIPVRGDFDGDGRADPTVYVPTSGWWYRLSSATPGSQFTQWGFPGASPVQ